MKNPEKRYRERGFSLIELMIVVGIISILAAVAFPAYTDSINKSRRADATKSILECASIQERRYTLKRSYDADACDNLDVDGYVLGVTVAGLNRDNRACDSNGNRNCYLITATNNTGDDDCATISLDELGTRTAAKDDASDNSDRCWRRT